MREKKLRRRSVTAGILFAVAAALRWCLNGYGFSAFCFLCAGCSVGVYTLALFLRPTLPKLSAALNWAMSVFLVVYCAAFLITGIWITRHCGTDEDSSGDVLIVLGAGVNGSVPSRSLAERLTAAEDWLRENPEAVCIVSGTKGFGEDLSEAECMFNELTRAGIAPERVYMETEARDTRQNFTYSFAIADRIAPGGRITVVTSEYHTARARLLAEDMGRTVRMRAAKTTIVPLRINYYLREVAGMWKYLVLYRH